MPWNVDLLVIIAEMGDFGEISTKNGVWGKRNVVLLDRSVNDEKADQKDASKWGTKMNATIWGDKAKKPDFAISTESTHLVMFVEE